jgi:outer membrane protein assembly factor BamB
MNKRVNPEILLLVLLTFLASIMTPVCVRADSSNSAWSMFRGDAARTGYLANASSIVTGWNYSIYSPVLSSPAVSNGLVFIKGEHLLCLNSSTGAKVWESSINSARQFSSPIVSNGYVYACNDLQGTVGGEVYALNETNGEQIWSFKANVSSSTPAVANGIIYVGSDNGDVYAIDAYSGQKLWNYSTGGAVNSSPAATNGIVYVASDDGNVYALNASTGNKIWNYTNGIAVQYSIISSPTVANEIVYVGSDDSGVYALNATTGDKIWNFANPYSIISTPVVSGNSVFVVTSLYIYALDALTGAKLWEYQMNPEYAPNGNEPSSPAAAEGVVYVNSFDYNLYAFNASTGDKVGNFTVIQTDIDFLARFSSPAIANNTIYVGIDGTLCAINISSFSIAKSPSLYIFEITAAASFIVVACLILGLLLYRKHRKTTNSSQKSLTKLWSRNLYKNAFNSNQ